MQMILSQPTHSCGMKILLSRMDRKARVTSAAARVTIGTDENKYDKMGTGRGALGRRRDHRR